MIWNTCPRCGAVYAAGDGRTTCNETICVPEPEQSAVPESGSWKGALAWVAIFAAYLIAGWVAS